jgi:hypothetical protein
MESYSYGFLSVSSVFYNIYAIKNVAPFRLMKETLNSAMNLPVRWESLRCDSAVPALIDEIEIYGNTSVVSYLIPYYITA